MKGLKDLVKDSPVIGQPGILLRKSVGLVVYHSHNSIVVTIMHTSYAVVRIANLMVVYGRFGISVVVLCYEHEGGDGARC